MPNRVDITAQRFGMLTVLNFASLNKHGCAMWKCRCDCGNLITVLGSSLRRGNTRSCSCLVGAVAKRTHTRHGCYKTAEYQAYADAKERCTNPKSQKWKYYGGRGIKFLFTSFEQWLEDLGQRPSRNFSVDRRNNDGHYEPGNLRWATRTQQQNNRGRQ